MNAHNEQQALPCPFCGAEPDLSFNSVSCGCAASPFIDREDAMQVWNTRAAQPSPVVKQNLTTDAAAQEAVAWFTDDHLSDKSATTYDPSVAERWRKKGWPVTALYAAPVTAAPTLDDELAQDRMSELCKLESDVLDVLPSVYYMDPPDGGDVSLGEQVKRMAEDAALWRKHISTPAAPGIDLARVQAALKYAEAAARHNTHTELAADFADLIRRIDASPKGDEAAPLHAHYCNAQPASAACICGLDSPKGGSEAVSVKRNCAPPSWMFPDDGGVTTGWRAQASAWLEEQAVEQERTNAAYPAHVAAYPSWVDRVHWLRSLADKVVQAQAGDAEVQP